MDDFFDYCRSKFRDLEPNFEFTSLHKRAFLAIFFLVSVISIAMVTHGDSEKIIETAPMISIEAPKLTIDVAGGVRKPGVYSLPANSRVIDAIAAAGGAKKGTDTSDINLARIIRDGEQIYVESPLAPAQIGTNPIPIHRIAKSGPININRATAKELEALPGIGPVLAGRIFTYRKSNGPFSTIEDLQKVSGIGRSKFAELKSKVRV